MNPLYIIGIGASAGGLDALERFFQQVPNDSNLAFVVIQHLSPDFKSVMGELLARHTSLKIRRVTDAMQVEPNTIYLISPRKNMILVDGRLILSDQDPHEPLSFPIDIFFRSLAQDMGNRAISVVLSGSGSDGSRGIRDVYANGGVVLVQEPSTADFEGMPRSAIATGFVHVESTPEEMPDIILDTIHKIQNGITPSRAIEPYSLADDDPLVLIFEQLLEAFQIDFQEYKSTTVLRRIERRMAFADISELADYANFLQSDLDELERLYRDLLVEVTEFFRDPQSFQALSKLIPQIVDKADPESGIRVWVPGCATGEEAYSIAMLFRDYLDERKPPQLLPQDRTIDVTIFATDVHQGSLDLAKTGIYNEKSVANLPIDFLERYLTRDGEAYHVIDAVRRMVIFANHNLTRESPFPQLDLISCRNVLIYFQSTVQQRVLSHFHFGLKRGGVLTLGPSEQLGRLASEFEILNRRWRIFRKHQRIRPSPDIKQPRPWFRPRKSNLSQPYVTPAPRPDNLSDDALIQHLENELNLTRENLQATIEELETSNEELVSTNEELQSANQELQAEIVAHREDEEALRQSQQRYQAVVQSQTEMICRYQVETLALTFVNDAYCRYHNKDVDELIGGSFLMTVPERRHAELRDYIQFLITNPESHTKEYCFYHDDGTPYWQEWVDQAILDEQGEAVEIQAIGRDITTRKRNEETIRHLNETLADTNANLEHRIEERTQEIERRREVAEGMRDILNYLNAEQSLTKILEYLVDQARTLLGADASVIHRYSPGMDKLIPRASLGFIGALVANDGEVPIQPMDLDSYLFIADLTEPEADPRLEVQRQSLLAQGYYSLLSTQLTIKDELYGYLTLCYREHRAFEADEVDLVTSFCDQAALAIENARLRTQMEEAAAAAERNRIAQDLHDSVNQTLFSAKLIAELLPQIWEKNPAEGRERLQELRESTRGAEADMRTLLLELRPKALAEATLPHLLELQQKSTIGRGQIPIRLEITGEYEPPQEVKFVFYRTVQEALNNILKHADASQASIHLKTNPSHIRLTIQDDGYGFDPAQVPSGHMGLNIMRERAQSIGATLTIKSKVDIGTEIMLLWKEES